MTPDPARVAELAEVRHHLHERIRAAGGSTAAVRIVAVSKTRPTSDVAAALAAGFSDLGESYATEFAAKALELQRGRASDPVASVVDRRPHWHFIGQLQTNKVRVIAPFALCLAAGWFGGVVWGEQRRYREDVAAAGLHAQRVRIARDLHDVLAHGVGLITVQAGYANLVAGERPEAARDVGQAMAKNPTPLIIPCHRVLAAGGRIGGFSAPGGSMTKIKMLLLEGVNLAQADASQPSFGF